MTPTETPQATWRATVAQFWALAGGFWTGAESRRRALGTAGALMLLAGSEVALMLRFNTWNRDLFDALERRDAHAVLLQVGVLLAIVGGFCIASAGQLLCRRRLALGWRAWLGWRLTAGWIGARDGSPGNPDGRIAEDARVATEEAVELAASLFHATMTLGIFVGVLWALSDHPPTLLGGVSFALPGYLLWLAVLYALLGMTVAVLAGRPLVRSTDHRQAREADYRAALVRVRDADRAGRGEAGLLASLFGDLAAVFERQSRAFARLEFFVCAVTRVGFGLPYLVATPAYLAGVASLGWLMQAAQAFQTVSEALRWPVQHMPRLATWRASAERVIALAAVAPQAAPVVPAAEPETVPLPAPAAP
ncbi:SbmA/BacA-like family transporter [Paracraurococcus lichenis]|uniref:SbmA/BacA-like family transporter n=1 Tax=Paracraurococcus lichenis TaxID=3064888 RepID=A0ABT9DZQ6_9PROT|nr:SbmA/BacA-like family transporter [Paracraurococcus sp. LOR1-02]MDO9709390.1 SbmA/BacA-like family transporter [Paracraurococcus sp. LOR1-02]